MMSTKLAKGITITVAVILMAAGLALVIWDNPQVPQWAALLLFDLSMIASAIRWRLERKTKKQ
ncbi:MAG: hypothetical protein J5898_11650 [Lachnospiraceae bacterium]|nr:hypothetical protein [Lachnospiraceae bacterium]MBP5223302.1 hypothetical protein [Lachnospiraceae bacterium]